MGKNLGINVYEEACEQFTRDKSFEGYVPEEVCISLSQNKGCECIPTVIEGEYVCKGDVIGRTKDSEGVCVHASISGCVEEIFKIQRAPESYEVFIRIKKQKNQNQNWHPFTLDVDQRAILKMMDQSGIPSRIVCTGNILVVNGFANEPYITSGYRLIMESPGKIVLGAILGAMAADAEVIYLCVNEDAFDAVARLKQAVKKYGENLGNRRPIWIVPMKHYYPGGNDKIIRQLISAKERSKAAVVSLAETAALYDGVYDREPWIKVGITVSGNVKYPKNLWVPIGTNVKELLDYCGGCLKQSIVICGGPLGGTMVHPEEQWIRRDMTGILVLDAKKCPESNCVHCGMCREVCPTALKPDLIEKEFLTGSDPAESLHANACIRCGLCSYVCPAQRRLTEYVGQVQKGRTGKQMSEKSSKGNYIQIHKRNPMFRRLKPMEQKSQSAPHIHRRGTIRDVMRNSLIGLIPLIAGILCHQPQQSIRIVSMIFIGAVSAWAAEYYWQILHNEYVTVSDGSALFSGTLLALLFSVNTPLWKISAASVLAILLGKQCFGGIGHAPIHPVMVGKLLFDPFGAAVIEPLWYLGAAALVWMLIKKMQPWYYAFVYMTMVGIAQPEFLQSALVYITAAYFVWSYETMAPTASGRWFYTIVLGILTILFERVGMKDSGIYFAVAFSNLLIPVLAYRFAKSL